MDSFARGLITDLIDSIEGDIGSIAGDSGGLTVFGLSSRYHGRYVARAVQLIRNGQREQAYEEAVQIYYQEYYTKVYGWQFLEQQMPWLMVLLFYGRVHGTGQRDYVREVQTFINRIRPTSLVVDGLLGPRTLSVLRSMNDQERSALLDYLTSEQVLQRITGRRVEAVRKGGAKTVDAGIRNRIRQEVGLAKAQFERGGREAMVASSSEKQRPWEKSEDLDGLEVRAREPQEGVNSTALISV